MATQSAQDIHNILPLTRELCAFTTNLVADDNELLFTRLQRELAFDLIRYETGDSHNGWVVPPNWRVRSALIKRDGEIIFDATIHPLALGMLSRSFVGNLSWEELQPHLVTNPDLPDAYMFHSIWQIRNWAPDWVFSIPYGIYETMGPGQYEIDLRTEYEPGEMIVAEFEHKGSREQTIIFNTNTCHPTQANDGFAAVSLLVRLFQWLSKQDTNYTYRLILGPEIIGSTFYMRDRTKDEIANIVSCIFAEMPGNRADLCATSTFLGGQAIDQAFHNVLLHQSSGFRLANWREGCGNDETIWEAPGYEIPTVELTRSEHFNYPYREYHSSRDNPDLMEVEMMNEYFSVLQGVIEVLENDSIPYRHFEGLICLSNPAYDLYFEREDPTIEKGLSDEDEKWGHLLDSLMRYFDGSMSVLAIAERHELPFGPLLQYLKKMVKSDLISLDFNPIQRPVPTKRRQSV
jgi:aminopeptidase-like protein